MRHVSFDAYWNEETGWDFGLVQVSTDGAATYMSLSCPPLTFGTDETKPAGFWVDNITVGSQVFDGSSLAGWQSMSEFHPAAVANFIVTLLSANGDVITLKQLPLISTRRRSAVRQLHAEPEHADRRRCQGVGDRSAARDEHVERRQDDDETEHEELQSEGVRRPEREVRGHRDAGADDQSESDEAADPEAHRDRAHHVIGRMPSSGRGDRSDENELPAHEEDDPDDVEEAEDGPGVHQPSSRPTFERAAEA
jgi:hypothetical protein